MDFVAALRLGGFELFDIVVQLGVELLGFALQLLYLVVGGRH